jgi:hypothetical protein
MRQRLCGLVASMAALACASVVAPAHPRIDVVGAWYPRWPNSRSCEPVVWTAPTGRSLEICLDRSTAMTIDDADVRGLRIEDRRVGEETWYLVSALLERHALKRLRAGLTPAPDQALPESTLYPVATARAVLVDGELSVVPPRELLDSELVVAAARDLARADVITRGWDRPVVRAISDEILTRPVETALLEDLIARPTEWVGRRVSVQGYLLSADLYLSRDQAQSVETQPSVRVGVEPRLDANVPCSWDYCGPPTIEFPERPVADLLSRCEGDVRVEAFFDVTGWGSELTRVERISTIPEGVICWSSEPATAR